MGRKLKPLALRIAEGDPSCRGKKKLRQLLAQEPKAADGLPPCPRHLKGRARHAWTFWSTELKAMGLEKRPDAMMLEGACVAYARAVEADIMIAEEGMLIRVESYSVTDGSEGGKGKRKREPRKTMFIADKKIHPAEKISRNAWLMVKGFCSEFGLSPVSRTRLAMDKKPGATARESLMKILSAPREKREPVTPPAPAPEPEDKRPVN